MLIDEDFRRTEWFAPEVDPTIPGSYECTVGTGFIFRRLWQNGQWINHVTRLPTKVRMMWRGVVPGSVSLTQYSASTRDCMEANPQFDSMRERALTALNN